MGIMGKQHLIAATRCYESYTIFIKYLNNIIGLVNPTDAPNELQTLDLVVFVIKEDLTPLFY